MKIGTIERSCDVALRQETSVSGLASPECRPPDETRSCKALRCFGSVTNEYQSDSSSKQPILSVVAGFQMPRRRDKG
jgi:hypothetical protein